MCEDVYLEQNVCIRFCLEDKLLIDSSSFKTTLISITTQNDVTAGPRHFNARRENVTL